MKTARNVWARIRSGVQLEVLWDYTTHGARVGTRYHVTRKSANAASGTIVPGKTPFRFPKYRSTEVRIDGPDTYTVLEDGQPKLTLRIEDEATLKLVPSGA